MCVQRRNCQMTKLSYENYLKSCASKCKIDLED